MSIACLSTCSPDLWPRVAVLPAFLCFCLLFLPSVPVADVAVGVAVVVVVVVAGASAAVAVSACCAWTSSKLLPQLSSSTKSSSKAGCGN